MIVATLLWDPNHNSRTFSRCYDESWVEKLFRGFRRNTKVDFTFICFTDRERDFGENIWQLPIKAVNPSYACGIEPYRLDKPMILVGLDTIVTGNIDHLMEYCLSADTIALPRDPYMKSRACNGVALVPAGKRVVYDTHSGQNDMDHMRAQPHVFIDDLWPGQVVSYKGDIERNRGRLGDARIVYFHGFRKPHELPHVDWISEHWT